jgi:predicted DsbA family dithiol-disulfide isomerase
MARYKVTDFSEIDFLNVDPGRDEFILPDGKIYAFSDHMCDFCWTAGIVMENRLDKSEFYCLLCKKKLNWYEFKNDFLTPTGDMMRFLLPEKLSRKNAEKWFREYKQSRLAQESIRTYILEHGKG